MKRKLHSLKEKLTAMWKKSIEMGTKLLGCAMDYVAALGVITGMVALSLMAPAVHSHWLRSKVGSKVYMIRDSLHSGGGTGFAIKAPSGISYILTNDHVCHVSKDGNTVLVSDDNDNLMRRRIIAHDENSDLCLIEGLPGVEGLEVSMTEPGLGDRLTIIGHPALLPLTASTGEMIGKEDILVPLGPISVINPQTGESVEIDPAKGGIPADQCTMNKHRQVDEDVDFGFFTIKVKWCAEFIHSAYTSNVQIRGGNSGSPVVNWYGSVEGVAFAADSASWGRIVSRDDVNRFLKNY